MHSGADIWEAYELYSADMEIGECKQATGGGHSRKILRYVHLLTLSEEYVHVYLTAKQNGSRPRDCGQRLCINHFCRP